MAYKVRKREFGIYHFLYTDRAPAAVQQVESQFRYNEDVIKWLTMAVEDVDAEVTAFQKLRDEGSLAKQISDRGR